MKIKWLPIKGYKPNQIYSRGLEYCFINGENEQCHEFVYCKDFMQDAVHGFLYEKCSTIYGFTYDPKSMPHLLLEKTKIALGNSSDSKFLSKIDNVLDFINQICKKLKLKPTTATTCENPLKGYKSGVVIFTGSSRWQEAAPMLSLYTLLLRIGFVHKKNASYQETMNGLIAGTIKPYQTNDASYLTSAKKGIDQILNNGYRKIFYQDIKKNYPKNINIGTMHYNFGIVGFTSESPKQYIKGWYAAKKKKPIPLKSGDQYIDCELGICTVP